MARGRRKQKKLSQQGDAVADPAGVEAELAHGGLAIYERGGNPADPAAVPFHVVPADVANSLRFLVARLHQADDASVRQTIAVTSALTGEGVTSMARSLAVIFAHDLDRKVCLLETNWWISPDAATASAVRRPGLAGVLGGSCSLDEALMHTNDDRLAVLPSGQLPVGDRSAAAGSSGFSDVLDLLTKWFDTVVIDAPPVLTASEATTIARQAEATFVVVSQGVTTEEQLRTAIDELEGVEGLGVIVNRSSTRVPKFLQRFAVPV